MQYVSPINFCHFCEFQSDQLRINDRGVGATVKGFWYNFFHIDYPILYKLFELCPFMRTALVLENHVEGFFLGHTQSPEISSLDNIFAVSEQVQHWGYSDTFPLFQTENMMSRDSMSGMLPKTFSTQYTKTGSDAF